jgi:hypothetical protein
MSNCTLDRSWKRSFVACFLVTTAIVLASDVPFAPPATGRYRLNPSLARDVLRQCSRATPAAVSGAWQPSNQDIDELEGSLPKYLQQRANAGEEIPPQGQAYHRQYVGFTRKAERYIYGNFYPARAATGYWKAKESKQAVVVCDGGPAFWGIVFRVSTKTFEEIQFNGLG